MTLQNLAGRQHSVMEMNYKNNKTEHKSLRHDDQMSRNCDDVSLFNTKNVQL